MARKPTFRELYTSGQAEPVTPYQKRIARGVDRGLTTAQARGHARTSRGEQSVTQLRKVGKLPKRVGKSKRYTPSEKSRSNRRHTLMEFPPGATTVDVAEYIHRQSEMNGGRVVTFQMGLSHDGFKNSHVVETGERDSALNHISGIRADHLETDGEIDPYEIDQIVADMMSRLNSYMRIPNPRYAVMMIDTF